MTAKTAAEGGRCLARCELEVRRLESLLSEFTPGSDVWRINEAKAGERVEVTEETCQLISRCHNISVLTRGAFDITAGALKKLYRFNQQDFRLPEQDALREALRRTGYRKIELAGNNTVRPVVTGVHISFGAIGKGYAADRVKSLMQADGSPGGVIDASGDLTAWGTRADGSAWRSGIAHPDDPNKIIWWLPLREQSIATSGNYEQFFDLDGQRYSHNIDPNTGRPVRGIKSVSVVSQAAELCDALATAVTVMGREAGLHLIDQLPDTHCLIIDENNRSHHSKNIHVNLPA